VQAGVLTVGIVAVGVEHVTSRALSDPLAELFVLAGELADAHERAPAVADA
jgi:hypothetical protein